MAATHVKNPTSPQLSREKICSMLSVNEDCQEEDVTEGAETLSKEVNKTDQ